MNKEFTLELPWPPTVNTYWRRNGNKYFISEKGQNYKKMVYFLAAKYRNWFSAQDRISVHVEVFPPDKKARDLDNLAKSLLDSLANALVYPDDSQIDELHFVRRQEKNNCIKVTLKLFE